MVKLRMTRGLPAPCPHLAERGVGHGLELVVRGGGDPRVGQPHRHHLVQGQRHGGGALGPAGSTHMLGRALQIYRDLAPDSQHPLPRIPDSCYQVQTERQQSSRQQFDNYPAQLPAPCTLSCLICVDIMQMLPPLTISTLHSIYTVQVLARHGAGRHAARPDPALSPGRHHGGGPGVLETFGRNILITYEIR